MRDCRPLAAPGFVVSRQSTHSQNVCGSPILGCAHPKEGLLPKRSSMRKSPLQKGENVRAMPISWLAVIRQKMQKLRTHKMALSPPKSNTNFPIRRNSATALSSATATEGQSPPSAASPSSVPPPFTLSQNCLAMNERTAADFLGLLERMQSQRMDDQRCEMPKPATLQTMASEWMGGDLYGFRGIYRCGFG